MRCSSIMPTKIRLKFMQLNRLKPICLQFINKGFHMHDNSNQKLCASLLNFKIKRANVRKQNLAAAKKKNPAEISINSIKT